MTRFVTGLGAVILMNKFKAVFGVFLLGLGAVFITGCGEETVRIPDTTRPVVTSTIPANGTTGVPLNQVLAATFSKPISPATINTTTFSVAGPGATVVAGAVTYSATGSVATFTPAVPLTPATLYTATLTTGIQDTASPANALAANYVWTFTTLVIPPVVLSTVPSNNAVNVPLNQVLSATFSKFMNPATLNTNTFTLSGGGLSVSGTVAYSGTTATFTPASALKGSTNYTATITTSVQDTSGASLQTNYVWVFTTAPAPPAVVSTNPVNGATGVPLNQVIAAAFSKAMNPATINATTFTLSAGNIPVLGAVSYAGNTATFTPAVPLLTNTLYTVTITSGAQDTTGIPLATNYVFTFRTVPTTMSLAVIATNPVNGATSVPLNQILSATFNEAVNPTTVNNSTFTVTGPGGTAITGVVGYVAAGSVATFAPAAALAADTLYTATITTGVQDLSVPAASLATKYTWTFTTGAAQDNSRPAVISTIPTNAATGVPVNQIISATFSKPMNPVTINGSTFTVTGPGNSGVFGLVSYSAISNTATFTQGANLLPNTLYTATVTTGATDVSGNALASNYVFTFTTGTITVPNSPTVVSTNPAAGAVNVSLNQAVSATFSKAMDPLSLTTSTFFLTGPGASNIAGTISYDAVNFIATFTPTLSFLPNSIYTATVTNGATDLSHNPLGPGGSPNPWSFTTGVTVLAPRIPLGTAALYGGFGGTAGITNQGIFSVINGNLGTTGVSTLITGFHDGTPNCVYTETPLNIGFVNGTINTAPPPPTVGCPNEGTAVTAAAAARAAADSLTAYGILVAFPNGLDVSTSPGAGGGSAGELGNRTLAPGIYKSAPGTYSISQGDLTLDAKGDVNAFWVFQMAASLTVGTPSAHRSVLLVNGAQAKNVFWQVGTAGTINGILGGGTMVGTIISQSGISVSTAGVVAITTINGRTLVLTGPLTIVNTVINVPAP